MKFLNRINELQRLQLFSESDFGGLAVVYGRRRLGKSRLLLEWAKEQNTCYFVADQSAEQIQRDYFGRAVESVIPGFAGATYQSWASFFKALARQSNLVGWRGPLIIDEFPYLAEQSRELPSVMQKFVDEQNYAGGILVVLAGSSQRMMHSLVLDESAPLYGRAQQILRLNPLGFQWLSHVYASKDSQQLFEFFGLFGGTPKYWELAAAQKSQDLDSLVDTLVLDPLGPLHLEPDRLLLQEVPQAMSLRPIFDVIGSGANRISEIAGRIGQPSTSLSRPLSRLMEMDLIFREVPFGESAKSSKKSLYKISDPFFRLWFTSIAPFRALYSRAPSSMRKELFRKYKDTLIAVSWETTCRNAVIYLSEYEKTFKGCAPFLPAGRYWNGNGPEWDIVSKDIENKTVLIGEAKWGRKQCTEADIRRYESQFLKKGIPETLKDCDDIRYALFVRKKPGGWENTGVVKVYDADDILAMSLCEKVLD